MHTLKEVISEQEIQKRVKELGKCTKGNLLSFSAP